MRASVLILLALSGLALAKGPAAAPPPANPGALVLTCTAADAEVFVDGNKVGTTPLQPLVLPPGDHTIKVQKLGFAPFIDVFNINKKKETRLSVEPTPIAGVVKVTVNVEQAHVFVDGKFIGEAPITAEVGVGARAIQVSKGGFKDYFQNVDAVAGQEVSMEVAMEELPAALNPYHLAPAPPPKWFEKKWVWGVVAAAVAAAVVVVVVPIETQQSAISKFGAEQSYTVPAPH
jgi:PEGA domain